MEATAWSLLPPTITIALALWTKEVYVSLLVGIISGALIFTGGNLIQTVFTIFEIMAKKVGDNANILIFLVILGILVAAIIRSGATRAYGEWAHKVISGKKSALGCTAFLGMLIFIDDYFNCLTVGTIMRPITDKVKICRAKLAYIIDATAAPICIIAPVSSWAAAVTSSLPKDTGIDGFALFLQTIQFNLYAILAMVFMAFIVLSGRDFATMGKVVKANNENFQIPDEYKEVADEENLSADGNGKVLDLILPLIVLIAACVYGLLATGGIQEGKTFAAALADCDAGKGLVFGGFVALAFTAALYLPRKVVTFARFCESFVQGFKTMAPANFILCLAWTLSGICSDKYLNLGAFVGTLVHEHAAMFVFLSFVFFLVALGLAFATGTSWGTFGILIPIAVTVINFAPETYTMLMLCVAAILSGAVAGDHASPISDTTILASVGAQCHHIEHVSTQAPYVLVVSACAAVGFLVDGFTQNGRLGLLVSALCLVAVMFFIRAKCPKVEV